MPGKIYTITRVTMVTVLIASFVGLLPLYVTQPWRGAKEMPNPQLNGEVVVMISRYEKLTRSPTINLICDSVKIDSASREITIFSIKMIGANGNGSEIRMGWVANTYIKNNALVFKLPEDAYYTVITTYDGWHRIPAIKNKK